MTYYNNRGYEAIHDPAHNICHVTVRGYIAPDGKVVERGGPANPEDRQVAAFTIPCCSTLVSEADAALSVPAPVRETFHDALLDTRDLLGQPAFRNSPRTPEERKLFAAAYDAAQKIRAKTTVVSVNNLFFSACPSLFCFVDCFARDAQGAFWLMFPCCSPLEVPKLAKAVGIYASLAAYTLEAGEYIPANAHVRLGVWQLAQSGATFVEVPNDRVAARDTVIDHILTPPF